MAWGSYQDGKWNGITAQLHMKVKKSHNSRKVFFADIFTVHFVSISDTGWKVWVTKRE